MCIHVIYSSLNEIFDQIVQTDNGVVLRKWITFGKIPETVAKNILIHQIRCITYILLVQ